MIDEEVQALISTAYKRTTELLKLHKGDVIKVAERLLTNEVINREEMIELLAKCPFPEQSFYEEKSAARSARLE